jgi:hypothetical protein
VWGIFVCKEDRDKANKSIKSSDVAFDAIVDAP